MEADMPLRRDIRGNRDNLRYGSLERSTVPKYRLSGNGRVIGLGRDFRILKSGHAHREIVAAGRDSSRRQRRESLFSSVPRANTTTVKARVEVDDGIQRQSSYISLNSSAKGRKLSDGERPPFSITQADVSEDAEVSSSDRSHSPSVDNDEVDAWDAFRNDVIQQRHRELMKQTSSDPQNLEAWLSLLEHQEALLRGPNSSDNDKLTSLQRHTLVAMRISVYEQALSKIQHPAAHQRLVSGLMKEGSKIWDHEKQLSEWQRLLSGNISFVVKLMHLDFLMSNPQLFTYEKVLSVAVQYLSLSREPSCSIERDKQIVHLLLRITMFMKQAGYTEQALAIWQAYLEIAYFRPALSSHEYHRSFEEFWDSECPRIGEPGALGWARSLEPGVTANSNIPDQQDLEAEMLSSSFSSWVTAEKDAQLRCMFPARNMDETHDPFRIVLFSDIERYLLFELSADIKHELLRGFLRFCELPTAPLSEETSRPSETDPFLFKFDIWEDKDLRATVSTPPKPTDVLSLFADTGIYTTFSERVVGSRDAKCALTVLPLLLSAHPDSDGLTEYYLALEVSGNNRGAPRLAKKLLKQRSTSVRLYNAYAVVEARSTNLAAAEKVWLAVLSWKHGVDDQDIHDRLVLLRTWAWICTAAQQTSRALQVAGSSHQTTPELEQQHQLSVDQLSAAEQYLWSHLSRTHSQGKLDELMIIVDLLALLRYHSNNSDLAAALRTFEQCLSLSTFTQASAEMPCKTYKCFEQLHTNRNRLIDTHTSSPSRVEFRPKEIIKLLQESCRIFPHNFGFRRHLNTFTQKHGGFDRLRGALAVNPTKATSLPQCDPLIDHISAIDAAFNLPVEQGGTQHVVRAAFQHALSTELTGAVSLLVNVRSSPSINIAFLNWELALLRRLCRHLPEENGDDGKSNRRPSKRDEKTRKRQIQNAKAAFQTAVTNCPWVKDVYLAYLSFDRVLEHDVDAREWTEVYESMLERGLRICVER